MKPYNLLKMVQRHGQTLTLNKTTTDGSYDPATGSVTGSVVTSYEITAYMYDVEAGVLLNDIRRGTRNCVIPALGLPVEPDDGDTIEGNGDTVSITRVTTHFSAGMAVCYICEVSE